MNVSRRGFLVLAGGTAVAVAGSVAWWVTRDEGDGDAEGGAPAPPGVDDRLAVFLSDPDGARRLGAERAADDPRDADAVAAGLAPVGADPRAWWAEVDDEAFAVHVRARVDDDLAAGRAVVLHGWWLARTEADLCLLAHLTT